MYLTDDPARLRACIRDLAALSALPLLWVGQGARDVVNSFLDVYFVGLRLDFVYCRLGDPENGTPIEAAQIDGQTGPPAAPALGRALTPAIDAGGVHTTVPHPLRDGTARIALSFLDSSGTDRAVVVAGSRRPDFPNATEVVFITAVINQATIWLRSARAAAQHRRTKATLAASERLQQQLEEENAYLREQADTALAFGRIVGHSPALRQLLPQVELVAPTDATVLVLGESGSGKELFAREIHQRSKRAHRPLITVNCSAIPHEVFESEFFGHVRGAFTGAVRDRPGRFQLAHGGTIFLDEVGDIPIDLQPKLLRVLQEGQYERVGEDTTRTVDVRVIAATNRDLMVDVEAGRFREDLYYRLSVFPLQIPPLRERRDDIPRLAAHLVAMAAKKLGLPVPRITDEQADQLKRYDWPGNVRELQNLLERAVILSKGARLHFDPAWLDVGIRGRAPGAAKAAGREIVSDQEWRQRERDNLVAALKHAGGRIYGPDGAAELLGVKPSTLQSRLRALGVRARDARNDRSEAS
jgi:transcriptional regulator with GAF, ATPase, and Fis domain